MQKFCDKFAEKQAALGEEITKLEEDEAAATSAYLDDKNKLLSLAALILDTKQTGMQIANQWQSDPAAAKQMLMNEIVNCLASLRLDMSKVSISFTLTMNVTVGAGGFVEEYTWTITDFKMDLIP